MSAVPGHSSPLHAKELLSVAVGGNEVLNVKQHAVGDLWYDISAKLDIEVDHEKIIQGSAYAYVAATGNFGLTSSFQIGVDGFRLKCNELSIHGYVTESDADATITTDCFLEIGDFYSNYYEQLEFALSKDELEIRYVEDFGIKIEDITFIQITNTVGCQFRSGPNYYDAPIARIGARSEIAFLGDDRDHRGWLEVVLFTEETGWVKAFVGKKLTNMADEEINDEIDIEVPISPLAELFAE